MGILKIMKYYVIQQTYHKNNNYQLGSDKIRLKPLYFSEQNQHIENNTQLKYTINLTI